MRHRSKWGGWKDRQVEEDARNQGEAEKEGSTLRTMLDEQGGEGMINSGGGWRKKEWSDEEDEDSERNNGEAWENVQWAQGAGNTEREKKEEAMRRRSSAVCFCLHFVSPLLKYSEEKHIQVVRFWTAIEHNAGQEHMSSSILNIVWRSHVVNKTLEEERQFLYDATSPLQHVWRRHIVRAQECLFQHLSSFHNFISKMVTMRISAYQRAVNSDYNKDVSDNGKGGCSN